MEEQEKMFRFEYTDSGEGFGEFANYKDINVTLRYDDAVTWCTVLRDFLGFLGQCYGYDITDQVHFETSEERLDRLKKRLEERNEQEGDSEPLDWL